MKKILFLSFLFVIGVQFSNNVFAQDYVINPQDVLEISVYEEDDLSLTVRVNHAAKISYPLIGELDVSGLSVRALEEKIEELLEKDYLVNPQVSIFIKEFSSIYIYGEVKNPGSYPLKGKLTVVEAISLAGGFTTVASRGRVRILRYTEGKEKSIRVNVSRIIKKNRKKDDVELMPRDVVVVPTSFF